MAEKAMGAETLRARAGSGRTNEDAESALMGAMAPEDIRKQVAEDAYYRAERRGFAPGYDVEDWLAAEADVMTRLGMSRARTN